MKTGEENGALPMRFRISQFYRGDFTEKVVKWGTSYAFPNFTEEVEKNRATPCPT